MTLPDTAQAERIASPEEAIATAAAFAQRFGPTALRRDRERSFPLEELREIARSGLLAIKVPAEFGGIDAGLETVVEVVRLLSVADPSIGQLTLPQFVISHFLRQLGSEDQQRRLFGAILEGARFGNATQPNKRPGAKPGPTIARRVDENTVRLDGEKYYSTGSFGADYISVAALDENEQSVTVIVPGDADGLVVADDDWEAFGQRATISGSVRLDGVLAPVENVWSSQVMFEIPNLFPAVDQSLHASVDVGIARAALADAAWFVSERANPARESGLERATEDPHTLYRLGQLRTRLDALEALLRENTRLIDRITASGDRSPQAIQRATRAGNEIKALSSDVGVEIAGTLFELTSTSGTDARYGFDRHWRNIRTHSVNVANRWRYHQIGEATLVDLPSESPTQALLAAELPGPVAAA